MAVTAVTKKNYFQVLWVFTLILCIAGFVLNVSETFHKFFNKATLVLSSTKADQDALPLPVFVICNQTAFKEPDSSKSVWAEQEYLEQTINPFNILLEISKYSPLTESNGNFHPAIYHTSELNTAYMGRCLCIELNETQVREHLN